MPGAKQAWPTVAACWSPATPRIGIAAPRMLRLGHAEIGGAVPDLRAACARGTPKRPSSVVVPGAVVDVEEQRPRGVGGVGGVDPAAGQPPDQEGVDGAEAKVAALGPLARALHVVEQPGELGAGEIGIEEQAAAGGDLRLLALAAQRGAGVGGAPVLPDDGAVDRLAGLAVPDHHRLALVGDADAGDRRPA